MTNPNYEEIKERYLISYKSAIKSKRYSITDYIEDWPHVLNEIQKKVYDEIKSGGVYLYPIYPVGNEFINFGNPFVKVGIEILYKTNGLQEKSQKLNYLRKAGWTVFTFETKYVSLSLADVFESVAHKYSANNFEDLPQEEKQQFIESKKSMNLECLLYDIREITNQF